MLGIIRQRTDQASPEERLRRAGGDLSRQGRAQEARQGRLHRRGDGRRGGVHRREDRHAEEPRRHGRGPQDAAKDQVNGRSGAEGRAADDKGRHNFGARGAARPAARHDAHAADKAPGRDAAGLDRLQDPARRRQDSLERLAKRYVDLDDVVSELDDMIDAILADAAPLLVQLKCVGAQSAAQLMVTVGDNPERLRSEASFAMLCGVAPVPVSSGMTYRHRLNCGGDRQTNSAIHIIAIGRLRTDERTKEYVAKKMSEGHTKMEAIRCLKRYIAREVYYVIKRQSELVNCSRHLEGHPRVPICVSAFVKDHARQRHPPVDGLDILAVGQRGHVVAHGHREVGMRARPDIRHPRGGGAGSVRVHRGRLQQGENPFGAGLSQPGRVRRSQLARRERPPEGGVKGVNGIGVDSFW